MRLAPEVYAAIRYAKKREPRFDKRRGQGAGTIIAMYRAHLKGFAAGVEWARKHAHAGWCGRDTERATMEGK